jgi:Fe-S oxidoreductase
MALIKAVLDGRLGISDITMDRLETCTTCLACETSCPSEVPVTGIIQAAKEQAREASGTGGVGALISGVVKLRCSGPQRGFMLALHYRKRRYKSTVQGSSSGKEGRDAQKGR